MPPALAESLAQTLARWQALPGRIRALLIVGVATGGVVALTTWAITTIFVDYHVLFSNLSAEDTNTVVDTLRAARVPHRLAENGQVLVPAAQVHEWRLKLASQGVPSGGAVGFEIFDKNSFGMTDFSQRLNFQRALQGELARTIGQLKEVQQARVHLALPSPRVFSSQEKPPSASVVLRLRPGGALRPDQVRGIVNLVSASVEGLSPDRVTVIDASGRVLANGPERGPGPTGNQYDARGAVEQDVERRVQSLLDPIVGAGRSAVRVSAILNFDQIERTKEQFDPKPLPRSQTKTTESTEGQTMQPPPPMPPPAPVPEGSKATTPPAPVAEGSKAAPPPPPPQPTQTSSTKTQRENEQTTWEIARTIEKVVVAPGQMDRLSIAVLLDVPLVEGKRTPRPDDEIERIKRLVASAAGVRTDRDELEVLQVPFDPNYVDGTPGKPGTAPANGIASRPWPWTIIAAVSAVVVVAVALALWRASRRRRAILGAVTAAIGARDARPELPTGAGATGGVSTGAAAANAGAIAAAPLTAEPVIPLEIKTKFPEKEVLKERVLAAAREHPEEIAQILRAWIAKRRVTT